MKIRSRKMPSGRSVPGRRAESGGPAIAPISKRAAGRRRGKLPASRPCEHHQEGGAASVRRAGGAPGRPAGGQGRRRAAAPGRHEGTRGRRKSTPQGGGAASTQRARARRQLRRPTTSWWLVAGPDRDEAGAKAAGTGRAGSASDQGARKFVEQRTRAGNSPAGESLRHSRPSSGRCRIPAARAPARTTAGERSEGSSGPSALRGENGQKRPAIAGDRRRGRAGRKRAAIRTKRPR